MCNGAADTQCRGAAPRQGRTASAMRCGSSLLTLVSLQVLPSSMLLLAPPHRRPSSRGCWRPSQGCLDTIPSCSTSRRAAAGTPCQATALASVRSSRAARPLTSCAMRRSAGCTAGQTLQQGLLWCTTTWPPPVPPGRTCGSGQRLLAAGSPSRLSCCSAPHCQMGGRLPPAAASRTACAALAEDVASCRLGQYYRCGAVFGKLCCCIAAVNLMYLWALEWLEPASSLDAAPDIPPAKVAQPPSRGKVQITVDAQGCTLSRLSPGPCPLQASVSAWLGQGRYLSPL